MAFAISMLSLSSCKDDSLSGLYYYESTSTGERAAFNFINDNTVEVYYGVTRNSNETYHGEKIQPFPLCSGWYYWSGNKRTYSYTITDDVVVIGDDIVMVKSGNTLIYDNLGVVLYKWDENESPNDEDNTPTPGEYVDLGLSSGTLWATKNVGANKPEDYGDYFAWGEITPKQYYDWSTYKWCEDGEEDWLTKYCRSITYCCYGKKPDNKTELDLSDDAAYKNMGSKWQMPTTSQQDELRNSCSWKWVTYNNVIGILGTSNYNGKKIFFPAAGSYYKDQIVHMDVGPDFCTWSRNLNDYNDDRVAKTFSGFKGLSIPIDGRQKRCEGKSVRAVRR